MESEELQRLKWFVLQLPEVINFTADHNMTTDELFASFLEPNGDILYTVIQLIFVVEVLETGLGCYYDHCFKICRKPVVQISLKNEKTGQLIQQVPGAILHTVSSTLSEDQIESRQNQFSVRGDIGVNCEGVFSLKVAAGSSNQFGCE